MTGESMRSILVMTGLALGLAHGSPALASSPPSNAAAEVNLGDNVQPAVATQQAQPLVLIQDTGNQDTADNQRGGFPWLLSGAAGALIPLSLFAIPALVLAAFGPFAPLAFVAAIGVAALTTAAGGALAWGVSAVFSNLKSGFFLPIFYSTLTGMGLTFLSGTAAALIVWSGVAAAYLLGGARNLTQATMPNFRNPFGSIQSASLVVSSAIATVVWGLGIIGASVAGPMVAAFTYRARGEPKRVTQAPSAESPSGSYTIPPQGDSWNMPSERTNNKAMLPLRE